ncbi:MAG: hypothetical protein M3P51_09740, partial [Chloroflexota bacterium]|nr:hypothetical protein [Chloroflexota bacterium]
MRIYTASAPGKVILLGEHAVNRRQAALATAVNLRVLCTVNVRHDDVYSFRFGTLESTTTRSEMERFRQEVDSCRESGDHEGLRARTAGDFFAPTRYALARLAERAALPGLDAEWRSELPVGSGLGSGAAASASLLQAVSDASGVALSPRQVAELAWHGDIVAHGGVASGLDSGASALGGLTLYSLQYGPRVLSDVAAPALVIGDTGVQAHTREVNSRVRALLAAHPARAHLFREIGLLVEEAVRALALGNMETLGGLLNLNQLV